MIHIDSRKATNMYRGTFRSGGQSDRGMGYLRPVAGLSYKNPRVQALRRLITDRSERRATGDFVIEGPVSTIEAVRAGVRCRTQFVPDGSNDAIDGGGRVVVLAPGVIERIGSTRTPQPPLTVAERPRHDIDPGAPIRIVRRRTGSGR